MDETLDKKAMREAAFAIRARIPKAEADAFAKRLARMGPGFAKGHGARSVSAFSSIGDEIETGPLVTALHASGFAVGLPVTGKRGTPLTFRRWRPEIEMIKGRMDILEPPPDAEVIEPDLLFVPLAAFDRRGHRIGYGAGFYDNTLARLRGMKRVTAVGVAYAAQEVLYIPAEDHDQPLDFVVTEKDTIVFTDAA